VNVQVERCLKEVAYKDVVANSKMQVISSSAPNVMLLQYPFFSLVCLENEVTTPLMTNYTTQAQMALVVDVSPHDLYDITQGVVVSRSTHVSSDTVILVAFDAVVTHKYAPLFTTSSDVDIALRPNVAPPSS